MEDKESFSTFCEELKVKTRSVHDESDKTVNLKLAVVLTDTRLWATALADFYQVFLNLEKCMESNSCHPNIGPLCNRDLFRSREFEKDLEFYLGGQWRSEVKMSPAAEKYCDHLLKISQQDPTLLIGYIHSMYLALLAGGQIIRRIVKRTLGLSGEEGLAIFHYGDESKHKLKSFIIDTINGLELTREEKDAILQEKYRCFRMNNEIANSIKPTMASYQRIVKLALALLTLILLVLFLLYSIIF